IELPVEENVAVTWNPRSRRAVALIGEDEFQARVIDVEAGKVIAKFPAGESALPQIAFCPGDCDRAAVVVSGLVTVVNVATGKTVRAFAAGAPNEALRGWLSPDGRLL